MEFAAIPGMLLGAEGGVKESRDHSVLIFEGCLCLTAANLLVSFSICPSP
jgi:hypothetical protein